MRVSKITLGRLFNLGSYEHIRYDITVEIPEGESATAAMFGLENIINALSPKRPANVHDLSETQRLETALKDMIQMSDGDFERRHGGYTGTRSDYLKRMKSDIDRGILRRTRWERSQKRARQLLDDVGGAADRKDAKLSWDDDYDDYDREDS